MPDIHNVDELMEAIRADELADQRLMTPVDYARLHGLNPQLVYYYLRPPRAKLEVVICDCGRKCIDVKAADDLFAAIEEKHRKRAGGIS